MRILNSWSPTLQPSSEGIGAVILQDVQPVAYGSRALTDCQRRYAQIEKELLAIVYGYEKFHQYVYGKNIQVESDHKPLESIFKKPLHQAPMRLQGMLLRLQRYSLKVTYQPGKDLHKADALSRAFLNEKNEELLEKELEVNMITHHLPMSEEKLQKFMAATAEDHEMHLLKAITLTGWPDDKSAVPTEIQPYWRFRDEITHTSGLMFKAAKLIVPHQLRQNMLNKIHEPHLGIVKYKERARDVLYWPHMSTHIEVWCLSVPLVMRTATATQESCYSHTQYQTDHGRKKGLISFTSEDLSFCFVLFISPSSLE